MPRALRPRETSALAITPVTVTDRTCAAVLGLESRVFREWLIAADVRHTRIGRRVVARVDDVLAALACAESTTAAGEPAEFEDDEQPETAESVLDRLGLRRSA